MREYGGTPSVLAADGTLEPLVAQQEEAYKACRSRCAVAKENCTTPCTLARDGCTARCAADAPAAPPRVLTFGVCSGAAPGGAPAAPCGASPHAPSCAPGWICDTAPHRKQCACTTPAACGPTGACVVYKEKTAPSPRANACYAPSSPCSVAFQSCTAAPATAACAKAAGAPCLEACGPLQVAPKNAKQCAALCAGNMCVDASLGVPVPPCAHMGSENVCEVNPLCRWLPAAPPGAGMNLCLEACASYAPHAPFLTQCVRGPACAQDPACPPGFGGAPGRCASATGGYPAYDEKWLAPGGAPGRARAFARCANEGTAGGLGGRCSALEYTQDSAVVASENASGACMAYLSGANRDGATQLCVNTFEQLCTVRAMQQGDACLGGCCDGGTPLCDSEAAQHGNSCVDAWTGLASTECDQYTSAAPCANSPPQAPGSPPACVWVVEAPACKAQRATTVAKVEWQPGKLCHNDRGDPVVGLYQCGSHAKYSALFNVARGEQGACQQCDELGNCRACADNAVLVQGGTSSDGTREALCYVPPAIPPYACGPAYAPTYYSACGNDRALPFYSKTYFTTTATKNATVDRIRAECDRDPGCQGFDVAYTDDPNKCHVNAPALGHGIELECPMYATFYGVLLGASSLNRKTRHYEYLTPAGDECRKSNRCEQPLGPGVKRFNMFGDELLPAYYEVRAPAGAPSVCVYKLAPSLGLDACALKCSETDDCWAFRLNGKACEVVGTTDCHPCSLQRAPCPPSFAPQAAAPYYAAVRRPGRRLDVLPAIGDATKTGPAHCNFAHRPDLRLPRAEAPGVLPASSWSVAEVGGAIQPKWKCPEGPSGCRPFAPASPSIRRGVCPRGWEFSTGACRGLPATPPTKPYVYCGNPGDDPGTTADGSCTATMNASMYPSYRPYITYAPCINNKKTTTGQTDDDACDSAPTSLRVDRSLAKIGASCAQDPLCQGYDISVAKDHAGDRLALVTREYTTNWGGYVEAKTQRADDGTLPSQSYACLGPGTAAQPVLKYYARGAENDVYPAVPDGARTRWKQGYWGGRKTLESYQSYTRDECYKHCASSPPCHSFTFAPALETTYKNAVETGSTTILGNKRSICVHHTNQCHLPTPTPVAVEDGGCGGDYMVPYVYPEPVYAGPDGGCTPDVDVCILDDNEDYCSSDRKAGLVCGFNYKVYGIPYAPTTKYCDSTVKRSEDAQGNTGRCLHRARQGYVGRCKNIDTKNYPRSNLLGQSPMLMPMLQGPASLTLEGIVSSDLYVAQDRAPALYEILNALQTDNSGQNSEWCYTRQ